MKLAKTLAIINQMQEAGVIGRFAIGGAVGAAFYLEPVRTLDVDVFVAIHPEPGKLIVTPKPVYDYLTAQGYKSQGEYLIIEGWPVQFLPPTGPLVEEAIEQAIEVRDQTEDGLMRTFVFTAEHLVAVALQTGRAKDKARILQFRENYKLDQARLLDILQKHRLTDLWARFEAQFPERD